jgi:DNA-binding SARP family transcriptional activator
MYRKQVGGRMDSHALSVNFFGPTLFYVAGTPVAIGLKGTTLELLWYLMIHSGHEIRRECVADRFWQTADESRQRSALSSALWRISKKIPSHPGLALHTTDSTVYMTIDESIPVDSRELCALVHEACHSENLDRCCAQRLEAALRASEAPFMDGIGADWALAERERISSIRIRGLIALMRWNGENRRYEDAIQIGRRILSEDPFREAVQIDMMWLYVLNGQRAQAIRQYQGFVRILADELGIEPMPETQALFDHIRNDLDRGIDGAGDPRPETVRVGRSRESLAVLLTAVEQSRRELYQTLRSQLG